MNACLRCATTLALAIPLLLTSGCLFSTRKLPVPRPPSITQTATPAELAARINQKWAALDTLTATVNIQATVIKTKEGVAKDYPTLRGHILMRKPGMLRVLGQLYGVRAFDMASDGKDFTLSIPTLKKAMKGSNSFRKKSANALENMRPGFFFDAMVVRGLDPDDLYAVTADIETIEDTAKKHLYSVPEYVLSIMRKKPGSQELTPERVVTIDRDDLLPYQQDLYDSEGNLETQVSYQVYRSYDSVPYPSIITIKRPLEDIQIILTVEDVKENLPLTDDQFVVKIPDDTKIQNLE